MNRRSSFLNLFAFAFLYVVAFSYVSAQEPKSSNKRTVIDAIKAMDSPSEKDMEWVTAFLEERVDQNSKDSLASCVLAITQVRNQEFAKALKTIQLSNAGDNTRDTRPTNGKFQLLCEINLDNQAEATRLFQLLLVACQRETTAFDLRKSYCEWMGEIIGTIDAPEAKSPIDNEILAKAKKSLLGMAETKLSQAFENQYSVSNARSQVIAKALAQLGELGLAGTEDLANSMSDELKKLEEILAASIKETKEVSSENQSASRSTKQEIATIRDQIRRIDAERSTVGPNMPVPVLPPGNPPIIPNRDAIYVNPIYYQYITETINNQRYTRQVPVQRDFRDIDAERSSIYQNQMNIYNTQMNAYRVQVSLYSQYQKSLAEWNRSEEDRRKKLLDQRNALEEKIAQLRQKLDEIEAANKENAGGNMELRKSVAKLKTEVGNIRLVLAAAKQGKPHLALRPTKIDPWLITEEKNRLLKQFGDKY